MAVARTMRTARKRRLKRIIGIVQVTTLLLVASVVGIVGGTLYSVWGFIPSQASIKQYTPTESTKIVSSDGEVLAKIYEENREYIPMTQIPKDLQHAIVAIEDKRFYEHTGVNLRAIGRALVENLQRGRLAQGGSTITQQLARNIYLSRRKTMSRKLQEVMLAIRIERSYSKEQILELYLNQIYFGSGAYGVETAAETYFGKKAKDLDLAQCALIAGLPQRPSEYSPYENVELAKKRRDVVLDRMREQEYITQAQCEEAKNEPIRTVGLKKKASASYKAPYFVSYVLNQLIDSYGADLIYKGGLVVYTTLNWQMQQKAEAAIEKALREGHSKKVHEMALLCMDPHNGAIRAMVGGADYSKSQFNRAVQAKRQPGSSFKLFVYTAAIESGMNPDDKVLDGPMSFNAGNGKTWNPTNYDGKTYGWIPMKRAVANSVNRAAIWTLRKIGGPQKAIKYAHLMGIHQPLDPYLPLALGASSVTMLEMVNAYGVIAAGGERVDPISILKITDRDGGVLDERASRITRVLSTETVSKVKELLRAVVTSGTGRKALAIPDSYAKTGTTQKDVDAWFIGFTPDLVTAVWAGNDSRLPMNHAFGSIVCAPAWVEFMQTALKVNKEIKSQQGKQESSRNPNPFAEERPRIRIPSTRPPSENNLVQVRICDDSNLLANDYCPRTHVATFVKGEEPTKVCNLHGPQNGTTPAPSVSPDNSTPPPTGNGTATPTPAPDAPPTPPAVKPAPAQETIELSICVTSHKIANDYCPKTVTKRFPVDKAPQDVCDIHGPM